MSNKIILLTIIIDIGIICDKKYNNVHKFYDNVTNASNISVSLMEHKLSFYNWLITTYFIHRAKLII